MRRTVMILLFFLCSLAFLPRLAVAQPVCFQASPFVDVFTLTVHIESTSPLLATLSGTMAAPGLYQLGGAGVLFVSTIDPVGAYALRVPMANLGSFFGGNAVCALVATVSPTTTPLTGSWRLTCTGSLDPFTVPGTMTQIPCPVVFPTAEGPPSIEETLTEMHAHGHVAAGEESSNDWVE